MNNKIISLKKLFHHSQLGAPQKQKKNPGALGTCPMCPLVKTALGDGTVLVALLTSAPTLDLLRCMTSLWRDIAIVTVI